mmetsp:Transcript_83625/g.174915  ORF Transcript_83625/g.174915 Transcript_83625/m.174915 type:complete len:205 (-) Transcript_83625:366-980(-)
MMSVMRAACSSLRIPSFTWPLLARCTPQMKSTFISRCRSLCLMARLYASSRSSLQTWPPSQSRAYDLWQTNHPYKQLLVQPLFLKTAIQSSAIFSRRDSSKKSTSNLPILKLTLPISWAVQEQKFRSCCNRLAADSATSQNHSCNFLRTVWFKVATPGPCSTRRRMFSLSLAMDASAFSTFADWMECHISSQSFSSPWRALRKS